MNKLKKFLSSCVFVFVAVYVILCFLVHFFPGIFLYHPRKEVPDLEGARRHGYMAERIDYKADDGTDLFAWYTQPNGKNKVVFFTHGNACNLDCFYIKLVPLQNSGYATFLPEYRGYGGIEGKTSQKKLLDDMKAGIRELYKMGYKNEDIIVYGMSLGSHQATSVVYHMKDSGKFDALILEVPFDNVPNTAKELFFLPMPFDLLFKDKYDNLELIKDIDTRLLIQIAEKDHIVPAVRGMNLYEEAAEPKDMMVYVGAGHNDLYAHKNYIEIIKWLEN